jgi:hypothetical protein
MARAAAIAVPLVLASAGAPSQAAKLQPLGTRSDPPGNPQIETVLVPPRNERYASIHNALKERKALEGIREFLAPLRLDRKLTVKVDECDGRLRVAYDPQGVVTLCYEYVAMIAEAAPIATARIGPLTMERQLVISVAFVQLALREITYAALDMLQIPVWGSMDDAADNVSALIMMSFGKDVALATILGTSWVFAQRGFSGSGDFADVVRASDVQRFYNQLCVAYGAKPDVFAFLVQNANLPKSRAERCGNMYRKLWISFKQAIMPNIDQQLLKQSLERDWGARLGMARRIVRH